MTKHPTASLNLSHEEWPGGVETLQRDARTVSHLCACITLEHSQSCRGDGRPFCERKCEKAEVHTAHTCHPSNSCRSRNTIKGPLLPFYSVTLIKHAHKRPAITHRLAGAVSLSWLGQEWVCKQEACVYVCELRIQGCKKLVIDFLMSVITQRKASCFQLTAQPSAGT